MKVALLISTYKSPEKLDLLLKTVEKQSLLPNEILIADDGTPKDWVSPVLNKYTHLPIRYFWHEDKGFRKGAILNKAVAHATSDYIIQVDGDCFLTKQFIEDHCRFAKQGQYLYGTRVRIKEAYVADILKNQRTSFHFFSPEIKKRPRILRIPIFTKLKKAHNEFSYKFRGCNMSFWRSDFLLVNGYNEEIEGWGREDSELVIRMHNNGIKAKRLKFCGTVFHLDHPEESKEQLQQNSIIQQQVVKQKIKRTNKGVNQYLK